MRYPLRDFSTVEEFLENASFRHLMTRRRLEDRLFWEQWLTENPDKRFLFEQAVATFLIIEGKKVVLSDQQVKEKAQEILMRVPPSPTIIRPMGNLYWGRWVVAAVIICCLVWWQYRNKPVMESQLAKSAQVQQQWKLVKNRTNQPLCVLLPDNSSVLLSKNSQLRYRMSADMPLREVVLQGEAFFEVTKSPTKSFIVYTTNLTTRVLGTSFQVRSFAGENTSYVKVKTGKVTVTPVATPDKPVLLTVNQQLKLSLKAQRSINEEIKPVATDDLAIVGQQFDFEYAPVPEIFDKLEATYYIPIQYNRDIVTNCTFTGYLSGLPFLEKIKLICLATESTYEVVDNHVVIHSNGCN